MSPILNKAQMTEEDIKLQYITPAITAKWSKDLITMETRITDGKINLKGNLVVREKPKKADYALNKIVTAYLDIAEVNALNQEPMYMKDWLNTIDDYLRMTRRDILETKGRVTHLQALEKAHEEYEKFQKKQDQNLSPIERHFLESLDKLDSLAEGKIPADR